MLVENIKSRKIRYW